MSLRQNALAALLLCWSLNAASGKRRMQGDVEILILEKSSSCDLVAKTGDKLAVHYVGKFKNGTVFDKGTDRVGRPLEFTMGDTGSFNSVINGWHVGVEGMCLGEKRRLVVPPHLGYGDGTSPGAAGPQGTLVFDIELITINGNQREVPMAASEFCDACLLLVERFHEQWSDTINQQLKRNKQPERSGDKPAALTYDDQQEEMVQGFCDSRQVSGGEQAPFVKRACLEIMKGHKREVTGVFLSSSNDPKEVIGKKVKICREMTKACPAVPEAPPSSSCGRCKAVVDNLAFDLRTQGPLRRSEGTKRQLWDTLEHLCMKMHYRVPKPAKTQEMCEDIIDEHGHELERAMLRGDDWGAIRDLLCGKLERHCNSDQLRDEL